MGAPPVENGVILIDQDKCVGCCTCILMCPYGKIMPSDTGVMQKCELCVKLRRGYRHGKRLPEPGDRI